MDEQECREQQIRYPFPEKKIPVGAGCLCHDRDCHGKDAKGDGTVVDMRLLLLSFCFIIY